EKSFLNNAKTKLYKSNHHIRDFLACVESRKKPITNEIVGARSAICCHLMNQAYYNGEIIRWDPKNNTFADKSGNSKWLTRDYRGQWKV
ncbi:MAG: gfo/Idh/MocA family oxidoreductase, partial [Verrucomicrobiales bacterium]|nr:gfo/Idh/MocA family oxidoreductase [Verrucomicrobiales bacterium]